MQEESLKDRIARLRDRLNERSGAWGGVTLCAATKTVDAERINEACRAGLRVIGENRVQEALAKFPAITEPVEKRIIGRLQTNKAKYVARIADMVESLDRDELADALDAAAAREHRVLPVLVQVNIAREPQKAGIFEEDLIPFLKRCAERPHLSVHGLMAIMPETNDLETIRPYFRQMRTWFDRLSDQSGLTNVHMEILSMGMSSDCDMAAEEGATEVRIGSLLFGARTTKATGE